MSFSITTKSHGIIEGGFFAIYTSGFRFGDYAFSTQNLHNAFRYLAENPHRNASHLISFNEDVFWEGAGVFVDEVIGKIFDKEDSYLPELVQAEVNRFVLENQGRFSHLSGEEKTRIIPVRVSDSEEEVSVAQYKVDRAEFKSLADYSINGGWIGWINGLYPESAQRARDAVKKSKRPLFN